MAVPVARTWKRCCDGAAGDTIPLPASQMNASEVSLRGYMDLHCLHSSIASASGGGRTRAADVTKLSGSLPCSLPLVQWDRQETTAAASTASEYLYMANQSRDPLHGGKHLRAWNINSVAQEADTAEESQRVEKIARYQSGLQD